MPILIIIIINQKFHKYCMRSIIKISVILSVTERFIYFL